jgi:5-methylcytosine-specific restriction endonuclease McrA
MTKSKTLDVMGSDHPTPMDIDQVHLKVMNSGVRKPTNRKRKAHIPKALRIAVWKTYIGLEVGTTLCMVCKTNTLNQMDFHCGHIVPEAEGGPTCLSNLRPVCAKCNLSMGTKNLEEFKDTYFK